MQDPPPGTLLLVLKALRRRRTEGEEKWSDLLIMMGLLRAKLSSFLLMHFTAAALASLLSYRLHW